VKFCESETCTMATPCALCVRVATFYAEGSRQLQTLLEGAILKGLVAMGVSDRSAAERFWTAYAAEKQAGVEKALTELLTAAKADEKEPPIPPPPETVPEMPAAKRKRKAKKATPKAPEKPEVDVLPAAVEYPDPVITETRS